MNPSFLVPDSEIRTWVGPFWDKAKYLESGRVECEKAIALLGLKPWHHMIDLGCGCGRMTIHLAEFLNNQGSYMGIDNSKPLLDWCIARIQPNYDNLHFQFVDVYNGGCNPEGTMSPQQMRIDARDGSIDVVLAHSLFTHMLIDDIESYLAEVHRVLRPNGRFLATFFLLNAISEDAITAKASTYDFIHRVGRCSMAWNKEIPEEAIAHSENTVVGIYRKLDYRIESIMHGNWVRNSLANHQDMILAAP